MDESTQRPAHAVFVDDSGLRRYWCIAVGLCAGAGLVTLAVAMIVGLLGATL